MWGPQTRLTTWRVVSLGAHQQGENGCLPDPMHQLSCHAGLRDIAELDRGPHQSNCHSFSFQGKSLFSSWSSELSEHRVFPGSHPGCVTAVPCPACGEVPWFRHACACPVPFPCLWECQQGGLSVKKWAKGMSTPADCHLSPVDRKPQWWTPPVPNHWPCPVCLCQQPSSGVPMGAASGQREEAPWFLPGTLLCPCLQQEGGDGTVGAGGGGGCSAHRDSTRG